MDFIRPADQTILTYWIGLAMVLAFILLVGAIVSATRLPKIVKTLVWIALVFRLIGSLARFIVLQHYYGAGDASGYFGKGWRFAEAFRRFDFSPVSEGRQWYGTEFIQSLSGVILALIGPSMFAEFVVFSLLAFIGLVGFAVAFRRAYPGASISHYLIWIWLFPSLWFWPSSIGKEAIILLGIGIAVMGFVGRRERINWILMGIGLFLIFAVRPQVVGVFLVSLLIAQWLSFEGRWTAKKLVQGVLLLAFALFGLSYAMEVVGLEPLDLEGLQEYVETDKARETTGRTSVEAVKPGVGGAPMALINILFRPLPWESTNIMVLVSSLEILTLWGIVFVRRRNLIRSLQHWRSDKLLRLAMAFVVIYSVALGLMIVNVGIIARQRIFLFPFIFLLVEAAPQVRMKLAESYVIKRAGAWRRPVAPASARSGVT